MALGYLHPDPVNEYATPKLTGVSPHETGERGDVASRRRDLKAFADDGAGAEGFLSECAVGLEDQAHGFVEVGSGFLERRPLGVGARKLFHEGNVALGHLLKYGG